MKLLISTILFFQLFALHKCGSKEIEFDGQSWLNTRYLECLKNGLPCECEKIVGSYFSIALDTNSQSKNHGIVLWEFDENEPDIYPIKNIGHSVFEIIINENDVNYQPIKLSINGDSLFLTHGYLQSKFINLQESNGYDIKHHEIANVVLLNKSLYKRGYPSLEKIVNEDSLRCNCNVWMGNTNLLYVKGAPKSWILKFRNDTLSIERITNVDRDPEDSVQTQKVIGYRWK